jgi:FtsP/CotA-like multicopper oxidase with cupredoxin domain
MKRRDFLKLGATGLATIVVGSRIPFLGVKNAFAATKVLDITITDAMKGMVTDNAINKAECYFWVYKMRADGVDIPVDCPGPSIYAIKGDTITLNITNSLDEPHSFFIPGIFDSGPIAPGATLSKTLNASQSGAHLYYDNLNEPVNRVMGLHGAMVVRPAAAVAGHNFTPYDNPTTHVQNIYDDFGNPNVWPGLKWEQGDPATNTPPVRAYVWLYHQPSPNLFAKVGSLAPGVLYDPKQFMNEIARSAFTPTRTNDKPQYFTINGQSGFFSHFSPAITPMSRVGEPQVIHILNAGVQSVSHHIHCNHFFITSINGVVNPNPIWVDVYGIKPMERIDYTYPMMRPPDNANIRGIGRPDQPLKTANGQFCWPPQQEMQTYIPALGTTALNAAGGAVELGQRLSPLCYPGHDHLEPSQTAQGGNYNCGLISGIYVIGDRNAKNQGLGDWMNFPMDPDFFSMFRNIRGLDIGGGNGTREAAGPRPA